MTIVENEPHRVVADRLDAGHLDIFLAHLQYALSGAMPLHFRRRRQDTQVFERQLESIAVIECDDNLP